MHFSPSFVIAACAALASLTEAAPMERSNPTPGNQRVTTSGFPLRGGRLQNQVIQGNHWYQSLSRAHSDAGNVNEFGSPSNSPQRQRERGQVSSSIGDQIVIESPTDGPRPYPSSESESTSGNTKKTDFPQAKRLTKKDLRKQKVLKEKFPVATRHPDYLSE